MNPRDVQDLTKAIKGNAKRLELTWDIIFATVTDGSDPHAPVARLDGDTVAIPMISMIGGIKNDTRVHVLRVPPSGYYVVGIVTTAPTALNLECTNLFGMTPGTTALGTYTTMPGTPTVTFTKAANTSALWIDLAGTFFSTGSASGLVAGVSIAGTAYDIAALSSTNASLGNHTHYGNARKIRPSDAPGGVLPAGVYTITGIWRRGTGAGTLNVDAGDTWSLTVAEVT